MPLAGLEPAACCCLGDGWVQTLCSIANFLVAGDHRAKVIGSGDLREPSRYPARTPSAASGHVRTRAAGVRRSRVAHGRSCVDGQSSAPVVDAVVPFAAANSCAMATTSVRNPIFRGAGTLGWGGRSGQDAKLHEVGAGVGDPGGHQSTAWPARRSGCRNTRPRPMRSCRRQV